ncbi:MAG: hypothetical protein AAF571_05345 [Verrucomicrobiota bacterium]
MIIKICLVCLVFSAAVTHTLALPRENHPIRESVDWRTLNAYQHTLTESMFRERLKIFSPDDSIYQLMTFHEDHSMSLYETPTKEVFLWRLYFLPPDTRAENVPQKPKISADRMAAYFGASWEKPLRGLTIGIDPGHIGGEWANIEERYFKYGSHPPVQEGDLTWITAQHLAVKLEAAGAKTVFTRTEGEPATSFRPEDFNVQAMEWAAEGTRYFTSRYYSFRYRWYREFLFYRVAEVVARAHRLHREQPDFTLCIHYNAAPWSGRRPRLFNVKKLVAFVHGSYLKEELESPTQKYELFQKLFAHVSPVEIEIADAVTREMQAVMKMKPENYGDWSAAHRVNDNPYIWSRNVIANRLFPGPVIFAEGAYMNDYDTFYRIQAGDYEGLKKIRGKEYPSLFREFADAMAGGLIKHYRKKRQLHPPHESP